MSGAASRSLSMVRKRQRGKSRPPRRAHYHGSKVLDNRKSLKRDSDPNSKALE